MNTKNSVKKIVITGPESSGKSTLVKELAAYYNTKYYPEYARTYTENLSRKYHFEDLVHIAKRQIKELSDTNIDKANRFIFYDTGLIITKIWFELVFKTVPDFLIKSLEEIKIDAYLLCYPDLVWQADKVRENSGSMRFKLFDRYRQEIQNYKCKYFIIKGKGLARFSAAQKYLSSAYCL